MIKYEEETKNEIIQPILAGEKTSAQVSKETGIRYATICDWVRRKRLEEKEEVVGEGEGANYATTDHEEISRIHNENTKLKEHAAFLEEENAKLKERVAFLDEENEFLLSKYLIWRKHR